MSNEGIIICADDELYMHMLYESMLGRRGYEVRCCNSGEEAIETIAEAPADLVILDVRMPGMGGLDACRELRKRQDTCDVPIIIVSADGSEDKIIQGLSAGADDYLVKPLREAELLAKVAMAVKRRKTSAFRELNLHLGSRFAGRYEIVQRIGSGGFSMVYDAEDTLVDPHRRVALKIFDLPPSRLNDRQFRSRFLREAYEHSRLDHRAITKLYDFGQTEGRYFIAMEFIDGKTLEQVIEDTGPIPQEHAALIGYEIARALRYLDEHKLVHRDVTPSNIIITSAGDVKLLDFGLARSQREQTLSIDDEFRGTPNFVSPEYVSGAPDLDVRSDLYSLGATLYYILSGEFPIKGESLVEVLENQVRVSPPPIGTLVRHLHPEFGELIGHLLAKAREDRPSVAAVLETLRDLVVPAKDPA